MLNVYIQVGEGSDVKYVKFGDAEPSPLKIGGSRALRVFSDMNEALLYAIYLFIKDAAKEKKEFEGYYVSQTKPNVFWVNGFD